jgi:2-iminobutanoate/2-iminopropanoate deaminase
MPTHRIVQADHLPAPAGPYSPAVVFERLVFVAGQGARVPATSTLASLDIEAQTEQCLRNVETILVAAGSSLQHVLRCGVFLIDMGEFGRMNRVYERVFAGHKPARTTVQAAALPVDGLRVEIDCIAYVP